MRWLGLIAKRIAPVALIVALIQPFAVTPAEAAALTSVTLQQTDPTPSAANNYSFLVSSQSATALRCISVTFNTAADASGSTPTGFSASSATFSGSFMSSWAGWTSTNTAGVAKVTRAGAVAPSVSAGAQILVSTVTNGSVAGSSVFALIRTYSDAGCTTGVDTATINFSWTASNAVSTTIDPSLIFTVAGLNSGSCNGATITGTGSTSNAISLGTVDKNSRAVGGQTLSVATNAGNGASVYAKVDGPLRDGQGHSIADLGSSSDSPTAFVNPGSEAFGYTINSSLSTGNPTRFTAGGTKWAGINTTDREVLHVGLSATPITGCLAYQITISGTTVGGSYGNNVTYTAVPNF